MSCHFTNILVYLLIIAAVISTQQTFTYSKPTVETLEKGVKKYEICSKLIINTVERRCGDFVNFEHISHPFLDISPQIHIQLIFSEKKFCFSSHVADNIATCN